MDEFEKRLTAVHTRGLENVESPEMEENNQKRGGAPERAVAHTPRASRGGARTKRGPTDSNRHMSVIFGPIKQPRPLILQDRQRPPFPLTTTVLSRRKELASPRSPSSLSAVTKRRTRRVSAAAVQPLIIFPQKTNDISFFYFPPDAVMAESETPKVTTPIARSSRRARLRN